MHPLSQCSSHTGTCFQLHSLIESISDKRRVGSFADFHCDHDGPSQQKPQRYSPAALIGRRQTANYKHSDCSNITLDRLRPQSQSFRVIRSAAVQDLATHVGIREAADESRSTAGGPLEARHGGKRQILQPVVTPTLETLTSLF